MSELDRVNAGEMDEEFKSYPEEVRQAALEYARGMKQLREFEPEPFQDGDVPDFVMVGLNGGTLFYSTSVVTSKFAQRVVGVDIVPITPNPEGLKARVPRMAIVVAVEMRDFEQIVSGSYQDALRTLLEDQQRKAAAQSRQQALPPGI